MGALVAELFEDYHEKEIRDYLSGYWLENDIWLLGEAAFEEAGIHVGNKKGILADFTSYTGVHVILRHVHRLFAVRFWDK